MAKRVSVLLSIVALLTALLTFGWTTGASAHATSATHPTIAASCQPASVEVVLEGTSIGHLYRCTGSYAVNDYTYYLSAGSWSGIIYRQHDTVYFCDGAQQSLNTDWTYSIYLSPSKEPWCR